MIIFSIFQGRFFFFFKRNLISLLCSQRLQRNIVRGLEGFIATGTKVVEIGEFLFLTPVSFIHFLGSDLGMLYP